MPKGTASRRPVIFDYIGVLTDPPDDAFTQIEKARGYPPGSVRSLVLGDYDARTPGVSAWHMVETGQLDVAHYVRWLLSRAPHVLGYFYDLRRAVNRAQSQAACPSGPRRSGFRLEEVCIHCTRRCPQALRRRSRLALCQSAKSLMLHSLQRTT